MMTGSAIRKPRIQPGFGSDHADSMIDGRTIETGISPRLSTRASSPKALVYAYASGKPRELARARPFSTICVVTHAWRMLSVFEASAGVPTAPSSR